MKLNAIILSGGKSSRMGSDKAMYHFEGKTLLARTVDVASAVCDSVYVVSDHSSHSIDAVKPVQDLFKNIGPTGGIYSGLNASDSEWNLLLSSDLPFINESILREFISQINPSTATGFVLSENGGIHPLIAVYSRKILPKLKEQIDRNQYSLLQFLNQIDYQSLSLESPNGNVSTNLNSTEDISNVGLIRISVKTFGSVQEQINLSSYDLITRSLCPEELKKELLDQYPKLIETSFKIAVNSVLVDDHHIFKMDDEIALLPPFAGG